MASEWFDTPIERRGTDSDKWNCYPPDVLPLWVADMDFRAPEPVLRALQERLAHGVLGYPHDPAGLREAITSRLAERYGWQVAPEALVFLPGVITGFNLAIHTLALPDGGVLVNTPVYYPILHAAHKTGALAQYNRLAPGADGQYALDWGALEADITDQTRMLILCNPHNPVGRVFRRAELERLAEICLRRDIMLCSDEIHCDLLYPGSVHLPAASLDREISRRTITLMAPSKTFNLPGLYCSFAIIEDEALRRRYQNAGNGLVPHVNVLGYTAALAAYRECAAWEQALLEYLQANRDFLYEYVQKELPGVRMAAPEGTYLAWLDCRALERQTGEPPDTASQFFIEKARVALNDGAMFGPGGEGFVRLNFGCPRSTLVEALRRIKTALTA